MRHPKLLLLPMFGSRGRSSSYASITDALPLQRQTVESESESDPQRKEQLKKLFELMDHHLASGAFAFPPFTQGAGAFVPPQPFLEVPFCCLGVCRRPEDQHGLFPIRSPQRQSTPK